MKEWIRRHQQPVAVAAGIVTAVVGIILFPNHIEATVVVCSVLIAVFVAWATTPLARPKSPAAGVPSLTIAEHFKRTNAYFQRTLVPVAAAWVTVLTLFPIGATKLQQQALSIGGCVVLFVIGWLIVRSQLRCPRCGTDFRKERIAKLGRWTLDTRGAAELWDACPHCGVSFSDPWP